MSPKFSIITVVRNAENTVERCIKSVFSQTFKDFEYIIVDGASTDNTLNILKRYEQNFAKIVSERDNGIYDAMNKGLSYATGEYIHFLNADDCYYDSNVLQNISSSIKEKAIYYANLMYITDKGKKDIQKPTFSIKTELKRSSIPQPTSFIPLEFYKNSGNFNTNFRIAADYDMLLRLAKKYPVKHIDIISTVMHSGGACHQNIKLTFKEAYQVSVQHGRNRLAAALRYYLSLFKVALR